MDASAGCNCNRGAGNRRIICVSVLAILAFYGVTLFHRQYVELEAESPLDYAVSGIQTPLYSRGCPKIPPLDEGRGGGDDAEAGGGRRSNSTNGRSSDERFFGNNGTTPPADLHGSDGREDLPRIFMISARPSIAAVLRTWSDGGFHVTVLPTFNLSASYRNDGGRCRSTEFHQRLTWVYSRTFERLLDEYPFDRGFVVLEDDAALADAHGFREEAAYASSAAASKRAGRIGGFYSFFNTELRSAAGGEKGRRPTTPCIYRFGMVAFYMRRDVMERVMRVVDEDTETFCRLPIDMMLSKWGPWYTSAREVVRHTGGRSSTRGMDFFSGGGGDRKRRAMAIAAKPSLIDT